MNCQAECPNTATHQINGKHVCYPHYLPLAANRPLPAYEGSSEEKRITNFILTEVPYGSTTVNYDLQQKIRRFLESELNRKD
jgi:hypothetical protein